MVFSRGAFLQEFKKGTDFLTSALRLHSPGGTMEPTTYFLYSLRLIS